MPRTPATLRSLCVRCGLPALAFCLVPKCPVCIGAVLVSLGMHYTIPQPAYAAFRGALLALPAAWLAAATYRRWKDRRPHDCPHDCDR